MQIWITVYGASFGLQGKTSGLTQKEVLNQSETNRGRKEERDPGDPRRYFYQSTWAFSICTHLCAHCMSYDYIHLVYDLSYISPNEIYIQKKV